MKKHFFNILSAVFHYKLNPFATGSSLLCGWRFNIAMDVVLKKPGSSWNSEAKYFSDVSMDTYSCKGMMNRWMYWHLHKQYSSLKVFFNSIYTIINKTILFHHTVIIPSRRFSFLSWFLITFLCFFSYFSLSSFSIC